MQISRLFSLLYILLTRDRATAPELARELEVSVRTIYRDVQALSEAGMPIYTEPGRSGGISILPTFKLNRSLLSDEERQSLLSSLTAAVQSGAQDQALLRKMTAFFGAPAPDWLQIDFADWSGKQDHDIHIIRQSILEKRVLAFDYYGESGCKTQRQVCPFTLWFKGQAWYLRAFCLSRRAVRTFKLTRLKRPSIIPGEFPPEADAARLNTPLSTDWPEPEYIHLRLRADACMGYRIYDDFSEDSITPLSDGGFLVDTHFPPGGWIKSIVLGYGEHAEVIEPPALRAEIQETLKNMAERYKP